MKILCWAIIFCAATSFVAGRQKSSYSYTLAEGAGRSRFTLFTGSLERKPKPIKAEKILKPYSPSLENIASTGNGASKPKLKSAKLDNGESNFNRNNVKDQGLQVPSRGVKLNVLKPSANKSQGNSAKNVFPHRNLVTDPGVSKNRVDKANIQQLGASKPRIQGAVQTLRLPGRLNGVTKEELAKLVNAKLSNFGSGEVKPSALDSTEGAQVTSSVHIHVAQDRQPPPPIIIKSVNNPARKHYNVILVKTPTAQPPKILLPQIKNENSEKSLIYLLHEVPKQPTPPKLVVTPNVVTQPEVFLIKYDGKASPTYLNPSSQTIFRSKDHVQEEASPY